MNDWQPIETAPETLERCLLWCSDKGFTRGSKHEPYGIVMGRIMYGTPYGNGMNGDWTFTHWQPLPAPPEKPNG